MDVLDGRPGGVKKPDAIDEVLVLVNSRRQVELDLPEASRGELENHQMSG